VSRDLELEFYNCYSKRKRAVLSDDSGSDTGKAKRQEMDKGSDDSDAGDKDKGKNITHYLKICR
jgi:hypothetical protein